MKIKTIKINNFKRFNDLTINGLENAKLVLIVGTNGSGKSSLLEACNYWYKKNCRFGYIADSNYILKIKDKPVLHNNVNIDFSTIIDPNIRIHKKIMYFRTAYRNDPDFNINSFSKVGIPYEENRIGLMIHNDAVVAQNFQRLVSNTLEGVFSEANDNKNVKDLREELIGKIGASMENVFDDLILKNLSDPLVDGSFYFKKGIVDSFHYKNLSGGEKSAFDLLLDLILKVKHYDYTVFFIDEPETHMHTKLQGKLVKEIYSIIPDNSQLWLTTHSLGVIQMAKTLSKESPESVAILDFSEHNFDEPVIIEPVKIDKIMWEKFLSITLDDFAGLMAPDYIVLCEGSLDGGSRNNFDASIYNKIFNDEYPDITFIAGGSSNDLKQEKHIGHRLLSSVLPQTKIIKLLDRDDNSDEQVKLLEKQELIVLNRRHIEVYLFDDEILTKLCEDKNKGNKSEDIVNEKNEILNTQNTKNHKPLDDVKSAAGLIYNMLKIELNLTGCGSNKDSFMRDTLTPLVSSDMSIYEELKNNIINKFIVD